MQPNIYAIMADCIQRGVTAGLRRYDIENVLLQGDIESAIWLELDSLFTFDGEKQLCLFSSRQIIWVVQNNSDVQQPVARCSTSWPPIKNVPFWLVMNCPVLRSLHKLSKYLSLMSGKKGYFPNNWQEFKDADESDFIPHTFEEVMSWKVGGWELPSSVCCIIRATNLKTKKVKEYVYQKHHAAQAKVNELINTPDIEFVVADSDSIHYLYPHNVSDD